MLNLYHKGMRSCLILMILAPAAHGMPWAIRGRVGVPVPLTVYGFNTQSDSVSTRRPLYGGLALGLEVVDGWQVGGRLGGMTLIGEDGADSADVWFVSMGGQIRYHPTPAWQLALGPSVLRNAIIIDENIRLDTWALGAASSLGWAWEVSPRWSWDVEVGLEAYMPPWNKTTWFNQALGRTVLLTVGVGASWISR